MIDGYTLDPQLLEAQWEEFDAIAGSIDMPFYYVPGNHDISNQWMEQQWRERLGRPYYAFMRKGALFIALHTEDGGRSGISEEQARFARETLEAHPDARWTFLFMHRPLWSYDNQEGFEAIDEALSGRRYTLFSGHHHNYYYEPGASGSDRYILGTAGGGSALRGPHVGEFDHITYVTLTDEGPKVAHLAIDGFVDKAVVNPRNRDMVDSLRSGAYLEAEPVVADRGAVSRLQGSATVANSANHPIVVAVAFPAGEGFMSEPAGREVTLAPGERRALSFSLLPQDGRQLELGSLPELRVSAVGEYSYDGDTLALPTERVWRVDWRRSLPFSDGMVTVDGDMEEWTDNEWIVLDPPGYLREGWDWQGMKDSRVRFALRRGKEAMYVALEADDDRHLLEEGELRDGFTLYLQAADGGSKELRFAPETDGTVSVSGAALDAKVEMTVSGNAMRIEAALPWSALGWQPDVSPLRFNVAYLDHDRPENQKPSQLFWKPAWGSNDDFPGSGSFVMPASD